MIRWEITDAERSQLETTLQREANRLGDILRVKKDNISAADRKTNIERLLRSLNKAAITTDNYDLVCYCDTNYNFYDKQATISYRIGDDEPVNQTVLEEVLCFPDEYLGIIAVLQALQERETTGRVQIISDNARCTIALHMGLQYKVPKHSENQSPRSVDLIRETYNTALALTKQLLSQGCKVEFMHRHRNFINEVLKIKVPVPRAPHRVL